MFVNRQPSAELSPIAASSLNLSETLAAASPRPGQKPARIIHMVADGMSRGTLTASDQLSQVIRGRPLTWTQLYDAPGVQTGLMNMRSLNSLVTDSSAASSSWGSGSRIVNGAVNSLPDGRQLTPLYQLFGEHGWKRGLVTTTEITHATPAGFGAACEGRDSAEVIADQYLTRRIEVLLGGGQKFYNPAIRKDQRNLWLEHAQAGYIVMQTAAELARAPLDARWLGTFSESHLPYVLDQREDADSLARIPGISALTAAALKKLERESHFILQIEGGRVDHGAHNSDAPAAFNELIAFDEAVDLCLEFQRRHPDTLLVITTDHGNGTPDLNRGVDGSPGGYALFGNLARMKASFDRIIPRVEEASGIAELQTLLLEWTGCRVAEDKARVLMPFTREANCENSESSNSVTACLGQLLADHIGIGWASNGHTPDYVPILALGPGSERFRGFIQNTDVFRHYLVLAGIDFENPALPLIG